MSKAKKVYVWRNGRVRTLKAGASLPEYLERHSDARQVCAPPSMERMEDWVSNCRAKTPCGCTVEPDGHCHHGLPSWLLVLGYI